MDIQYTVHVYVIYVHLIKSNVVLACIVDFRIGTLCTKSFTCIHRNIKKLYWRICQAILLPETKRFKTQLT